MPTTQAQHGTGAPIKAFLSRTNYFHAVCVVPTVRALIFARRLRNLTHQGRCALLKHRMRLDASNRLWPRGKPWCLLFSTCETGSAWT